MNYKKGFFGLLIILSLIVGLFAGNLTAIGAPGDYEYRIQVMQGGVPVEGATVEISGVGVEDTGADGIAILDVSDAQGRGQGRTQLYRGPRNAAKNGKASGSVSDLEHTVHIVITGPTFEYGGTIKLKLNNLYILDL